MLTIDLSLPFAGLLVLAAGFAGWWTRGHPDRGHNPDIDRHSPDLKAFEQRFTKGA